jgi:Sigma-70, region 4
MRKVMDVLRLVYEAGRSQEEIARSMGISLTSTPKSIHQSPWVSKLPFASKRTFVAAS